MPEFISSADAVMVSVSAATTSKPVTFRGPGGDGPRHVVATLICHGTFVSGKSSVTHEIGTRTSSANPYHWVPLKLDPSGVESFITSGRFHSAGATNIKVGSESAVRCTVATTATGPISSFYQS